MFQRKFYTIIKVIKNDFGTLLFSVNLIFMTFFKYIRRSIFIEIHTYIAIPSIPPCTTYISNDHFLEEIS